MSTTEELRAGGHQARLYMSIVKPDVVGAGTITDIGISPYRVLKCSYSLLPSGRFTSGNDIEFFDPATGESLGRTRTERYWGSSTVELEISETGRGALPLFDGCTFKIYSERRPRRLVPAQTGDYVPDGLSQVWSKQIIVNTMGSWAGWADELTDTVDVNFDNGLSLFLDDDIHYSAGSYALIWRIDGLVPYGFNTTNPRQITRTFTPGQHRVGCHLREFNGAPFDNTSSKLNHVIVHDANNPPIEVETVNIEGAEAGGWSGTFRPLEALSESDLPNGAMVIIWDANLQSADRDHIKLVGWVRRASGSETAEQWSESFDVVGPLQILNEMNGFSTLLNQGTDPLGRDTNTNGYFERLTPTLAALYMLRIYTNVLESVDIRDDGVLDVQYDEFPVEKQPAGEQVNVLLNSIDARLVATRDGTLRMQPRLELSDSDDASGIMITLEDDDVISHDVEWDYTPQVDILEMRAFIAGSNIPIFARFPGNAPGEGTINTIEDRYIVSSLTNLKKRAGKRGAFIERLIASVDGLYAAPRLTLVLFGSYEQAFDFYFEWVRVNLSFTRIARASQLSQFDYILESVAVDYADGTATTTIDLRARTDATPADIHIPPVGELDTYNEFGLTDPYNITASTNSVLAFDDNGYVYRTANFREPVRLDSEGTDTVGLWGYEANLNLDTDPEQIVPVDDDAPMMLIHREGVEHLTYTTGLESESGLSFARTDPGKVALASTPAVPGWRVAVRLYRSVLNTHYYTNGSWKNGQTFNTGDGGAFFDAIFPCVFIEKNPSAAGTAYTWAYTANGINTAPARLHKTTDYGATWTAVTTGYGKALVDYNAGGVAAMQYDPVADCFVYSLFSWNNNVYRIVRGFSDGTSEDISPTNAFTFPVGTNYVNGLYVNSVPAVSANGQYLLAGAANMQVRNKAEGLWWGESDQSTGAFSGWTKLADGEFTGVRTYEQIPLLAYIGGNSPPHYAYGLSGVARYRQAYTDSAANEKTINIIEDKVGRIIGMVGIR